MRRFFSKENTIGLLLLLTAVAAFCCLLFLSGRKPGKEQEREKDREQERELEIDGGVCRISDKKAMLYDAGGTLKWSSDEGLDVQDGLVTDLDGDGVQELILLLWKIGKYGKHRPFWEVETDRADVRNSPDEMVGSDFAAVHGSGREAEDEDSGYSQHIFIYEVSPELEVREKWCASDVGREIVRFKLMEKNNSIILTEDVEGVCNLWRWESFGLKLMDNGATIVAFGDNIIHKEIYEYANAREGGSYDFLYEPFLEDIKGADIAAFQQESMLVDKDSAVSGYPLFGSPLAVGEALAAAGFDVACCAGNHALDKGSYGIDVTTKFYREKGILPIGVQSTGEDYRPFEIINRNGISFALLDYTYGTGVGDPSAASSTNLVHYLPSADMQQDIAAAGEAADFVIVFVHWGDEYNTNITDYQKQITSLLAKGGADLVIGTHPHVLQDVETVIRPDGGEMLVFYSLGNFRAYQGRQEATKIGGEAIIRVEHCFDGVRIASHELKEIDAYVNPH